jgi:paraquat-inducible protein B
MKTKISPAVVGAFVLGAFAIGIIALLALGSLSIFSKPERFMVYFDESISGLDEGSPVKLRGVRVGHVVGISIRYDRQTSKSVAAVLCEINRGSITDENGANLDISDREALQSLVDRGLRAQLQVIGLATGLLFVELDFMDPHRYPDASLTTDVKYVVIPSAPSPISEFQASATTLLSHIQQVDFQGLSDNLKKLLAETTQRIDGVDFKGLVAQWRKTGESVDSLARSPEVLRTLTNLNRTLDDLRGAIAKLDTQVGANGKDLQATLAEAKAALVSFDAAAASAKAFIDAEQGLGSDTGHALQKIADAADSIQQLADFLERNPNAIISGRKQPAK